MSRKLTSDDWCTPKWLCDLLGNFDVDPCSNSRSHVHARRTYSLESGNDGLLQKWTGSVFCNPPYSDVMPWAQKIVNHTGPWVALVKLDPSTKWWALLMFANPIVAPFRKRLRFEGDQQHSANFPSVLVYRAWAPIPALAAHLWLPQWSSST